MAAEFYDVHVEADAEHEIIAAHDLAAGFVRAEPGLAGEVLFGAAALMHVEARLAAHLMSCWEAGRTSLLLGPAVAADLLVASVGA